MHGRPALDAAVAELAASGLAGWALASRARLTVHRQFTMYSCLSWWESPRVAFAHRRGYCVQYNAALRTVLRRLGFDCELVGAVRVRLNDDPSWRMGHVWVRVHSGGETRELCAGSSQPDTGPARFAPLTTVHRFVPVVQVITTAGLAVVVSFTLARAKLTGTAPPAWLHHQFPS